MATQTQQQTSSETGAAAASHAGQFTHNNRGAYATGHPQGNRPDLASLFGGLSMQNQSSGGKFNSMKGNLPVAMPPPLELAGPRHFNNQLVLLPNGSVFGGFPPVSPVSPFPPTSLPGHEQVGQIPYLPNTMYPSLAPGCPVVPAAMQGYHFPYLVNSDIQGSTGQKQNHWAANDEQKGTGTSASDGGNQSEYFGTIPSLDGSTLSPYTVNGLSQGGQSSLQLQMMKTPTGYILQDLESLVQQEPAIPRAVPAMWTNPTDLTLAKCLENREGITNVYIRGFLPETTDEMLHAYASRFGKIDRCKAIVDLDTGLCKGFGFVQYFNFESCENCIRGFFYLGYQASFAQKSRNSRLKDLEDKTSTNIYCTNIPIDWTEADLRHHFEPYRVVSEKISRDEKTGVSKEVGFARFETREIAEKVLSEYHNTVAEDGVKLLLRFADTKAQKLLKQQSNERRAYRAGEYNYSVEVVQGSTPSPSIHRLQQTVSHLSPNSQVSYVSPVGVGSTWTPATSISPSVPLAKNPVGNLRFNSWSSKNSPVPLDNTPLYRGRLGLVNRSNWTDNVSGGSSKTVLPSTPCVEPRSERTSPHKENIKAGSLSPISSRREIIVNSPRSVI
ncbi:putative RNA binding protein MSSP-2 [Aspergillus lucknowensis]|uniref:RRM domain-containing protein n=1 Tax=Aspergillus lucknowensis TaxID=176173 RepID=A0ABR4LXH1_9EURO